MGTHSTLPTQTSRRQTISRYGFAIAFSLVLAVSAMSAYRFTSMAPTPAALTSSRPAALVDPAQQSVLAYLRVHSSVASLGLVSATLDPAQQSVMRYVEAHSAAAPQRVAPLEPAAQAVLDYLRAHGR